MNCTVNPPTRKKKNVRAAAANIEKSHRIMKSCSSDVLGDHAARRDFSRCIPGFGNTDTP
jgi:hypothetical protein